MKIDMIVERESLMSKSQLDNPKWFPNYICIRRKAGNVSQEEQWQGFVKQIKNNQEKSLATLESNINTKIGLLESNIVKKVVESMSKEMKSLLQSQKVVKI